MFVRDETPQDNCQNTLFGNIAGIETNVVKSNVQDGEWSRLIWSGLLHRDIFHIIYNMTSFCLLGLQLELQLGSKQFFQLIMTLLLSCSMLYCAVAWGTRAYKGPQAQISKKLYSGTTVVGFSAVVFAMHMIVMSGRTGWQKITVPLRGDVMVPPWVWPVLVIHAQLYSLAEALPLLIIAHVEPCLEHMYEWLVHRIIPVPKKRPSCLSELCSVFTEK